MDYSNRRKYPRLNGPFQIDILNMGDDPAFEKWEAVVSGEGLDVSKEGMRIKSTYNVEVGCFLSVILYYKGQGSVCLCETVWKRVEDDRHIYGLFIREWSQLDPGLAGHLKRLEGKDSEPSISSYSLSPDSLPA